MAPDQGTFTATDPTEALTRYFTAEYLTNAGLTWSSVKTLPEADGQQVLTAASEYAHKRLGEIRNKAAFLQMLYAH